MPQMWPMMWETLFLMSLMISYTQMNKFLFMKYNAFNTSKKMNIKKKKKSMLW